MIQFGTFFHHIRQASAERGESLDKTLAWVREIGYAAAELDADDLDGTEYLKPQCIAVSSIYKQYRWKDMIDEKQMEDHISLALRLGSKKIMPIPGLFSENGNRDEELKYMLEGMNRLADLAKENGLIIMIEDYDDDLSPIATIEGMKVFLNHVPDLKVAFDTGNFAFSGDDVMEADRQFHDKTVHLHLKDRLWSCEGIGDPKKCADGRILWPCAVGDGDIPMFEILQGFRNTGYDGYAMAEFFGAASYADAIKQSIENLKGRA